MRAFAAFVTLFGLVIGSAGSAAAATPPHKPTLFDKQQHAKLGAWLGTWRCIPAAGGAAETSANSLEGSYYVTRYTGANSLTAYHRWDPTDRVYYTVRLLDAGGVQLFKSAAADPTNGVWLGVFPDRIKGRKVKTTLAGDRMTWGDMKTVSIDCRKQ